MKLKDIAKKLGVSMASVSKAINNRPGVSEHLKQRILQAAEVMNLQSKPHGGGPLYKNAVNVNLLVRINTSTEPDPFYSLITEGISKELQTYKTNLHYYVLPNPHFDDSLFREMFEGKKMDGVILIGADYDPKWFHHIDRLSLPSVIVDNMHPSFNSVNTDNVNGALEAVRYLTELGHKHISFLSGPLQHKSISMRYKGYAEGLQLLAGSKPRLIECSGVSVEDGYRALISLDSCDFTALFAANDKLAIGAMKALKLKGYRIPQDISIIGFDDIEWSLHTEPPLSSVRVAKQQIGATAASLFLGLYNKKDEDMHPVNITVMTKLVLRESAGSPPI